MKILFIDIDGPLIPDKMLYKQKTFMSGYEVLPKHQYIHDPYSTDLLNHLFDIREDLFGVLHSTWRLYYNEEWLKRHFELQGLNVRWHTDSITDPQISDRWLSIKNWLSHHTEITNNDYAILDDEKAPKEMKTRSVKVDYVNGISYANVHRLKQLIIHS